jgi:hypothetical protein
MNERFRLDPPWPAACFRPPWTVAEFRPEAELEAVRVPSIRVSLAALGLTPVKNNEDSIE